MKWSLRNTGMLLVVGLCCAVTPSANAEEYYSPRVGEPHFDFVLPRIDDRRPVWLSQFRGQKVLLIQFASW